MTAKATVKKSNKKSPVGTGLIRAIKGKGPTKKSTTPAKKKESKPVNIDIPPAMYYGGYSRREPHHQLSTEQFNRLSQRPLQWFFSFEKQLIFGFSEKGTVWVLEVVNEQHAKKLYTYAQEEQGFRFAGMVAGAKMLVPDPPSIPISREEIKPVPQAPEAAIKKERDLYDYEEKWAEELNEIELNKPISKRLSSSEIEKTVMNYDEKVKETIEQFLTKGRFNVDNEVLWSVYFFCIDDQNRYTSNNFDAFRDVCLNLLKFFTDPKISEKYPGNREKLIKFLDYSFGFITSLKETESFEAWLEMKDVYQRGNDFGFYRLKTMRDQYLLELKKLEVEQL